MLSYLCAHLVQRLKELVKILLEDHDCGADKLVAIFAALGDLDHVVAVVFFLKVEEVGAFACRYFFTVEVFVLFFHVGLDW